MFWNKKAVCPVDAADKELIFSLFQWLIDSFGLDAIQSNQVVLPTTAFFNRDFTATERDAYYVFEKICRYMGVDGEAIEIKFYENNFEPLGNGQVDDSSSRYTQYEDGGIEISLERGQLADPALLIASLAYELANYKLLGEGKLTEVDELLTELAVIVLGFGVFTANSSVVKLHSSADLLGSQWNIKGGAGSLHHSLHGFALALYAHYRGEAKPAWAEYLESDVYKFFKKSKKYIEKNPDEFRLDMR
jgi:hypothetical protein